MNIDKEDIASQTKNCQKNEDFTEYIVMNPIYDECIEEKKKEVEKSIIDHLPTSNEYEIMMEKEEGLSPSPIPLPPSPSIANVTRKTTPNNLYVSQGETIHSSSTAITLEKPSPAETNENDHNTLSNKCLTVTLFILIVIGLLLAMVAIVLALLLLFGVNGPSHQTIASCSSEVVPTIFSAQAVIAEPSSSFVPSPTLVSTCLCPTPDDFSFAMAWMEKKSSNITGFLKDIENELVQLQIKSNVTKQSLISQSNSISSQVSEINSTCHETLMNLTSQNISLAGLDFEAELRNVGVYSSCVYEYLSNCTMDIDTFNCTTSYHKVIVEGYYNMELSCHFYVEDNGLEGTVDYPLMSNLRMQPIQGQEEYFTHSTDAHVLLTKSEMRCDCAFIKDFLDEKIDELAKTHLKWRSNVTCSLYRMRCPVISTFHDVVIKIP